jgi:uridine phosphorylase
MPSSPSSLPLFEFDPTPEAVIEPSRVIEPRDVPRVCVVCFFQDVIAKVAAERGARVAVENRWEDGPHPLYEIEHMGRRLAFFHPGVGAPIAVGVMEEVIAFGCRDFIACGGCGVLEPDVAVGHLMVVESAVRDEGTSFHYLPPSRTVQADPAGVAALEAVMARRGLPYRRARTWTTDAPFRETRAAVAARRAEGCAVVEMEASALIALAQFRKVKFGQVLYGGDDLSGEAWEDRAWTSRAEIRENLFWIAAEAALELGG